MMKTFFGISKLNNQRGVTIVIVAICLFVLIAFTALAVDIGHLVVAKNELQNASDAGALAGARFLYNADGTAVNIGANQIAINAAIANNSDNSPVEVSAADVQRGHWSFSTRTFTPNASTAPAQLWGVSWETLDSDSSFINAIRVTSHRQATPIVSYFAKIFGFQGFQASATAIGYIGFAGTLTPEDLDMPIAICKEKLLEMGGGVYNCTEGRFINDAAGGQDEETGMWTSLDQGLSGDGRTLIDDPCSGGTNSSEVKSLVDEGCSQGAIDHPTLYFGREMEVNNGQINSAFNKFYSCWESTTNKQRPMGMHLPVIDCSNDPTTCSRLVGAVHINVIWVTQNPNYRDLPTAMSAPTGSWTAPADASEAEIWNSFARAYNLKGADGQPATYQAKTIYFLPSCDYHEPAGLTGGENFGILAKIPVLVD
jgi:Flp pilus assembly protein TadG